MRRYATGFALATTLAISVLASSIATAQPKDAGSAPLAKGDGGSSAPIATTSSSSSGAGSGAPLATGDKPAMDGPTYTVRLRDLEARVDELKDQIRRSHTRLALLSDTILSGGAAGSRSEVVFKNEMSSAYRLVKARAALAGGIQYNRADATVALADQKEIPVFTGSVSPGDHTVQVQLTFQGNGYGVFTYLKGYKFEVKSSHSFTVVEGKTLSVTATSLEKGGVTTPLDQRPAVEWREKIQALGAGGSGGGGK